MARQKARRVSTSSNDLSSDEDRPTSKKNKKRMTIDKETEKLLQSLQPRRVTRSMSRVRSAVRTEPPPPPKPVKKTESRHIPASSSKNSSNNCASVSRAPSFNRVPVTRAPSNSYGTSTNRPSTSRAPSNSGRKTPESVHRQNSIHYNTSDNDVLPFRTIKLPTYEAFMTRNEAFKKDIHNLQNDVDVIHNQIRIFADMCPKAQ